MILCGLYIGNHPLSYLLIFLQFNRALRLKANHMGYSLNQRGLWEGVVRDPSNRTRKLNTSMFLPTRGVREALTIVRRHHKGVGDRGGNFQDSACTIPGASRTSPELCLV